MPSATGSGSRGLAAAPSVIETTDDGNPLAVLRVDGTADAAAIGLVTSALVIATDVGLREAL
jgi:hypothetical protein